MTLTPGDDTEGPPASSAPVSCIIELGTELGSGKAYRKNLGLISEWVKRSGGDPALAFGRVLVVNNGLSALRLILGIRALSYEISGGGDASLIHTVALASDADWVGDSEEDASKRPEYLRQYGIELARLSGSRPAETYQDQVKIMAAAREFGCDAIAVGWGHLAENAEFRERVGSDRRIFIGPPLSAMQRMGDKIISKLLMQAVGVPMLPWSGSRAIGGRDGAALDRMEALLDDHENGSGSAAYRKKLFKDAYEFAGVSSEEAAASLAAEIGYPIVVKATAGGGGRGIRFVDRPEDIGEAFRAARAEARAAFSNDTVFIEKAATRGCRHVEEQVLCDMHGNVTLLGERECSIQRHNQKLIEESGDDIPITMETRLRIREASLAASRAAGYQSAGTIEYLVDLDGRPFFMEMNTRLQVEHIATEALMEGLDLVKEQLKVAMGIPLPPELRDRNVDFRMGGHSIAVRLLAENPDAGFSPQGGVISDLEAPSPSPGTPRCYFSHGPGASVHSFADSQIGHAVAFGRTRDEARLRMISYLDQLRIGGILTTRNFSLDVLRDPEYTDGSAIHTAWIAERMTTGGFGGKDRPDRPELALAAIALIDYLKKKDSRTKNYFSALGSGQLIRPVLLANTSFLRVGYGGRICEIKVREVGPELYAVTLGNAPASFRFREMKPSGGYFLVSSDEIFSVFRTDDAAETHIELGGRTYTIGTDLDPATFRAPLAGIITEIHVEPGLEVREGEPLVSLEAMKMITMMSSPRAGEVGEVCVEVGDNVDAGTVLVRFRGDNGTDGGVNGSENEKRCYAKDPAWSFPDTEEWPSPAKNARGGPLALKADPPEPRLTRLSGAVSNILAGYPRPRRITDVLLHEAATLASEIDPKRWLEFVSSMMERFHEVEHYFRGDRTLTQGIIEAEEANMGANLFLLARSHAHLASKRTLLMGLLDTLPDMDYRSIGLQLRKLAGLGYTPGYRDIVARSEELLHLLDQRLQPAQDLDEMMTRILEAESAGREREMKRLLGTVMEASESLMGRLVGYLLTGKSGLRKVAGKLIILRAYRRHTDLSVDYEKSPNGKRTYIWRFFDEEKGHHRTGVVSLVHPDETVDGALERLLERLGEQRGREPDRRHDRDVIELLVSWPPDVADMDDLALYLTRITNEGVGGTRLRRITYVVRVKGQEYPALLTLIAGPGGIYSEERLYRDVHPSLGNMLGLAELEPFKDHLTNMPSGDMNVHLYHYRKADPRGDDYPDLENRIFVRTMIRDSKIVVTPGGPTFPSAGEAFQASLRHLRVSYAATGARTHNNEIYLRFMQPIRLSWKETIGILAKMQRSIRAYADVDLTRTEIHGKVYSWLRPDESQEILIVVDNPTGLMLEVKAYAVMDHIFPREEEPERALILLDELRRALEEPDRVPPEEAWTKLSHSRREASPLDRKRTSRRNRGKVYVYDRPALLEKELREAWRIAGKQVPPDAFHAQELALDTGGELRPVDRPPGGNELSMVAWKIHLRTPETPEGREFYLVSGDMTVKGGSVAIREDLSYSGAAAMASKEGVPFVYFAEGSGARIGLDRRVSHRLRYDPGRDELYLVPKDHELLAPLVIAHPVDRNGESDGEKDGERNSKRNGERDGGRNGERGGGERPTKRYVVSSIVGGVPGIRLDEEERALYLTDADHALFGHLVNARLVEVMRGDTMQRRWVIDSIDTSSPEINQENLSGSARMARASSLAFHSVPTMAVVTDTCTGIISYNVRLLKRVVQTRESEIILTGYRALNALYGGEKIFTSNRELGGPDIMGPNGISHRIVEDEREACAHVVSWLRGLPPRLGEPAPVHRTDDPVTRDVRKDLLGAGGVITPPEHDAERPRPYDAMKLVRVLFDRGTVREEMCSWGKTVRVGRANLGGIPVGFIAVETDTAVKSIPADPAEPSSAVQKKMQFGQVWYPDSSFKTAQWIEFMRRERRSLFILPNWRGFAGGKLELFEEVVKYGAMIVDELSKYDLPVILYMPPYAEIRGGAWVVIDTQINPDHIFFLVDEHATGSVLEPSGMESVPLVEREIRKDMRGNDCELARLYADRKNYAGQLDRIREIDARIEEREKEEYPGYVKKWLRIFRKHNTAERMLAVGTAHEVVSTGRARERMYRALVRGLDKMKLVAKPDGS